MYIHANVAMNSLINIIHILISVIISLYSYIQLYIYNTLYLITYPLLYVLSTHTLLCVCTSISYTTVKYTQRLQYTYYV